MWIKPCKIRHNFKVGDRELMLMIIFGSGMFGKDFVHFKGHRHGVVGEIYAHLKHRESIGELCFLNIDEYYTSQVCNHCKERNLEHVTNSAGKKLYATLRCKTCSSLIWNHGVVASNNMWEIWRGEGRHQAFKPLTQQEPQESAPDQEVEQQKQQQQKLVNAAIPQQYISNFNNNNSTQM